MVSPMARRRNSSAVLTRARRSAPSTAVSAIPSPHPSSAPPSTDSSMARTGALAPESARSSVASCHRGSNALRKGNPFLAGVTFCVYPMLQMRLYRLRNKFDLTRKFRVNSKTLAKLQPTGFSGRPQPGNLRPGRLGIDEVARHRRDASPVVDPGFEQPRKCSITQIRRGLKIHLAVENKPRSGNRPQHFLLRRLRVGGHRDSRLGAEILDDDLLDVAGTPVQVANRDERVHTFHECLTNADQNPSGERNPQTAGFFHGAEAQRRHFVGR